MDTQLLQKRLDELARRSDRVLGRWALRRDLRLVSRDSLVWLLAAPILLLLVQAALVLSGSGRLPSNVWVWVLLAVVGPIVFIAARVAWLAPQRRLDRRTRLGAFDLQLDTKDRLVIADEFIAAEASTGATSDPFKAAAIDDAAAHIERATETELEPKELPDWAVSRRSWAAVPAALALIVAAMLLGGAGIGSGNPAAEAVLAAADLTTLPAKMASSLLNLQSPPPRPDRKPADERTEAAAAQTSPDASPKSTKSAQDAEGQSHAGGQASSRSSSQAMSSTGTPSNQQTPSKALEEDPPQDQKADAAAQAKKSSGKKGLQEASSATSGQGQSKTSSSDTNMIPATDQPDRAGANKDDGKDEEGTQDEVEEEKTAGVERPSLRKNKPPLDRNLSPRPTGDQPNPNANGRSGPGGRKKTRGVPAMILGVPTPDRIQGMTSPGRSKVTQENSTPKEEAQGAISAEERRARELPFGHIEHPMLQPWMQTLIEKYFTQIREKKPPTQKAP